MINITLDDSMGITGPIPWLEHDFSEADTGPEMLIRIDLDWVDLSTDTVALFLHRDKSSQDVLEKTVTVLDVSAKTTKVSWATTDLTRGAKQLGIVRVTTGSGLIVTIARFYFNVLAKPEGYSV